MINNVLVIISKLCPWIISLSQKKKIASSSHTCKNDSFSIVKSWN